MYVNLATLLCKFVTLVLQSLIVYFCNFSIEASRPDSLCMVFSYHYFCLPYKVLSDVDCVLTFVLSMSRLKVERTCITESRSQYQGKRQL